MPNKTIPALPTSDLRSDAKAYRRDKNHAAKWGRGGRVAPGKQCSHTQALYGSPTCQECVARPLQRDGARNLESHYWRRAERAAFPPGSHRQNNIAKKVLQNDCNEVTVNSDNGSSDEDIPAISEAPLAADEIMYSYDARSGPNTGSDVLSHAIVQAVKRFENKQTEQLVKNEYDVVLDGKDFEDEYAGDGEDDFEVIEHGDFH